MITYKRSILYILLGIVSIICVSCGQVENNDYSKTIKPITLANKPTSEIVDILCQQRKKGATRQELIGAQQALQYLSKLPEEKYVPYLLESISNENNKDRKIIMIGLLSDVKDKTYYHDIVRIISNVINNTDDSQVLAPAVLALGNIHTQESFNVLADVINKNSNPYIQYIAIIAIGDHYNQDAVKLLKVKAKSANSDIQSAAKYSLEKIKNPDFEPEIIVNPKSLLDKKKMLDRDRLLHKKVKQRLSGSNWGQG